MKHQVRSGLRAFIFIGIAAMAPACMDPESDDTAADGSDVTTSEAVSALSGTQRVCSWATIRHTPHGRVIGFLLPGDNFRVDRCASGWCDGHAYGHVHEDGWIELQHLQGC
jgi:hypothetical protein